MRLIVAAAEPGGFLLRAAAGAAFARTCRSRGERPIAQSGRCPGGGRDVSVGCGNCPASTTDTSVTFREDPTMLTADIPTRTDLVQRAGELAPLLKKNAAQAEEDRRLQDETIEALAGAGL